MRLRWPFILFAGFFVATALGMPADTIDLSTWTLDEKIGQFLMVGYRSAKQIAEVKPGGVVLFSWSMKDVEQTRKLSASLRELAQTSLKQPLFIATDHEGGRVLRLKKGMTPFPDAAAVGSSLDPMLAFRVGKAMGHELAALGINMNLAPVLDLGNARSFLANRVWGEEAGNVSVMTTAFIRGLSAARVLAVAKHFPGHGGSFEDSHFSMPVIRKTAERVWAEDLQPFQKAIEDGVTAVMTAHVEIPAIAKGPASLAPEFVTEILRKKMGFRGLVLTDDLEMGGVSKQLGMAPADLALKALVAGTDMILVVWSVDLQRKIVERVKLGIANGEVSEAWLDEKVKRIVELKARNLSDEGFNNPYWKDNLRRPEHLDLARRVAEAGIHWLAGSYEELSNGLRKRWDESWAVILPSAQWVQYWKIFRPRDQVLLVSRRADAREIRRIHETIRGTVLRKVGLVVVTPPRALGSEDAFSAIRQLLGTTLRDSTVESPIIWAHQGASPVEVKWNRDMIKLGLVSLHSGSLESFRAFSRLLAGQPEGRGPASLSLEKNAAPDAKKGD